MKSGKSLSFRVLIGLSIALCVFRYTHIASHELSWDVFGYYLPLPAIFINDDPLLQQKEWIEGVNNKYHLTETYYQISSTPDGRPMYFFLFGMSCMYLLFFGIGHFAAGWMGYPQDGFSEPYQYALVTGGIIFTILGMIYLRKILLNYFSERIVTLLLVILILGTNASHHLSLKNLETVNVLFMFSALLIWNTIRFHSEPSLRSALGITIPLALMTLVKPSEILFCLIPILWQCGTNESLLIKLHLFKAHWKKILFAILVAALVLIPQLYYWYYMTGSWLYDTYKNPGVGLDLWSPHILETLFSARKGWMVYTPVMFFSLLGLIFLYRKRKDLFIGILFPFVIGFYILSSWTEWWYGAGFSLRPVIAWYPLLAIPMGYFLVQLTEMARRWRIALSSLIVLCVVLNLFKWYQFEGGILDPYRTTREYFYASFFDLKKDPKKEHLLMISRSFSGKDSLEDPERYRSRLLYDMKRSSGNDSLVIPENVEYALTQKFAFGELTDRDHVWLQFSFRAEEVQQKTGKLILVALVERKEGPYGYRSYEMDSVAFSKTGHRFLYLTPEIRNNDDKVVFYFWNRDKKSVVLKDFNVKVLEKKN